jgi:hypothetical protein
MRRAAISVPSVPPRKSWRVVSAFGESASMEVWFIGFGGRKGKCIEWKYMNTFSLGWWVFKPPIFARYSKAILGEYYEAKWPNPRFLFCQGPYENIGKAELVELLNRWREKFGGTSEAAS